ncbi:MAG TPA: aminotransferase class III-fold pyridoxal phosphate-dependent enzyme, partial [Acidimicrobiia bacterium]
LVGALEGMSDGHTSVHGVHGRGLMIGVDFADDDTAHAVEQECFRRGLLVLTCGVQTVRLAPPLVVTREQADQAVAILDGAITEVERTARSPRETPPA